MGQLAGFRYRDVASRLRKHGFELARHAKGSHEVWTNDETGRRTVVPNHRGDLPEGTVRGIIGLAGITAEAFLAD